MTHSSVQKNSVHGQTRDMFSFQAWNMGWVSLQQDHCTMNEDPYSKAAWGSFSKHCCWAPERDASPFRVCATSLSLSVCVHLADKISNSFQKLIKVVQLDNLNVSGTHNRILFKFKKYYEYCIFCIFLFICIKIPYTLSFKRLGSLSFIIIINVNYMK